MYLLTQILIYLLILTGILILLSIFLAFRRKKQFKNKIKKIDNESKLIAIDELKKMLKQYPYNFQAREKLAELLMDNKSYYPAIKEYLMILDYSHNNPAVDEIKYIKKVADAYYKLENFEDAKKYYLIIKTKSDTNFDANKMLGDIELKNKNNEKAEIYFNTAYKVNPDDVELKKLYGICTFKLKKYKEAAAYLTMYVSQNQTDFEAVYYLALSLYNTEKLNDALIYLNHLKTIPEYSAEIFFISGCIHSSQKMFIQAIEDFNNSLIKGAIKEPDKLAELHYLLADSYFNSHNIPKAIEYWMKVRSIVPNYKDVNTKIETYSASNSNSLLEMYLVGSVNQFVKICKYIIKYYLVKNSSLKGTVKFLDMKSNSEGSLEILTEITSGNFVELNFFVFMRSATTVGDMSIRTLYNKLKEQKADKGICVTAGTFSASAKEFVETRMLKLIEKEELTQYLLDISQKIHKDDSAQPRT